MCFRGAATESRRPRPVPSVHIVFISISSKLGLGIKLLVVFFVVEAFAEAYKVSILVAGL
jgi:hypothetical protein